ncbi:hypothetical protein GCM10022267_67110 [Lentzea roselyniae]|uniref:Uncharacterized protein n=1 Tax=Lentzea roselyniae TaxID=531940 RepID=A0ABP7BXK2_9PSEU
MARFPTTTSKLKVTSSMAGKELTVTVVAVEAGRADGTAESKAVTMRG